MQNISFWIDLFLVIGVIAALIPIIQQLNQTIKGVKEAEAERVGIRLQIEFLSNRLDKIENWIAGNSGFKG
ncbi:hypothetical protein [Microcoleus sp. B4-D4]|uniref:hypothetical protein n=1 Tax=Microcoleus sp. B4-D4 TaxID=2818667 RepID=UPI002FD3D620